MNETVRLLLSLSVSASILAVFILAIKPLIRHKLSKSIQYYLWIVVLLRLILPFSFEESMMNQVFYGDQLASITDGLQVEANTYQSLALPNIQENVSNSTYNNHADHGRYFNDLFNQYAFYIWLLGVLIALAVNLTGYTRFSRYLKKANQPAADPESRMLTALLNGRKNVRLVRNPLAATPMLIGILRPLIIIPDINFSEKQLKNILLHELVHFKRFDIVIKWLTMIVASLHWFNPLVYFIKREINRACELSCDEAVIKNLSAEEKQAYGDTLISAAAENKYPLGVLQVTMNEEKATLKERLVAIMKYTKKSKAITLMSAVLLVVVIGGAVMLGGCAGKTNSEDTNTGIMTPNLTTNTKIENLLALIMSSPLESSNLGDYIAAHQEEYDAIIKMDAEALPYLFSEFEKGGQTGLKSHIMESLCRNILAGEDIKYANTDPQDWYDTYKAHMRSMLEKYSLEFLKEHNPKGSLVLNRVDVEISPEKLLSFIKAYDEKTRMLTIDEVEWVIQGDTKRVKALGLDADLDFPNGYYIYNESDQQTSLKVAEDVKVDLVNWHDLANPSLTNVNGLAERMAEYPDRDPLCHLTLKDGVIVGILEQYRP